jgi:hypothetical protein
LKQIPSDLKLLKQIYKDYYKTFISFPSNFPQIKNKYFIPIDFQRISKELNIDPDIIVGRLFNLDSKTESIDANTINFPLVTTILADLIDKERKYWVPILISIFSLVLSVFSLLYSYQK